MENQVCKNHEKCPIFNGVLVGKEYTITGYQKLFCNNPSDKGWVACKRYVVKEKAGKCPPDLLPNSSKSTDEIIKSMN